ncbi:MAG: UDP-N-acetylmuramoyl-L-alanyl-D-glutamate--2,6-diaminopimelate ligase [Muribaculaceae bacterium]|nr:UDP-N-acetylmuramoyl-L-alanyl-D-glutamate--2,6-diaminopimelate ligase [Muribaculaceae bacterium]
MEKKLSELLKSVKATVTGNTDISITGVQSDSRKVKCNNLFVAIKGTTVDGHKYIEDVIEKGAAAIVCQELPEIINPNVTYAVVKNSASALGFLASQWWDNPSRKLTLVGVTGTNGKTTMATLLYEMARLMGYKAGLLSTVCNYVDTMAVEATQTTPDQLTINNLLNQMVEAGCKYAFMEVSSHAADQCRIDGLKFAGGVFSNLTRDHLDYHKTVENYLKAKKRFFDILPAGAFALVNADDKAGMVMLQNTKANKKTYSLRQLADFKGKILESRLNGTLLSINGTEVEVLFTGGFNAYNLLAVYGASILMGFDADEVIVKMSMLIPVAGRFQTLQSPRGYTAIVDYAHTPDALVNVLDSIKEVLCGKGKIITVVGAGGNRDKGKRPIMAQEAARRSDRVILTSDNPRFEEPEDILADMIAGLDAKMLRRVIKITDRAEAIKAATQFAQMGDVILIAGKGHENYQDVKGVKHHFDDKEQVEAIFEQEKE